jgi:hypothetical protein
MIIRADERKFARTHRLPRPGGGAPNPARRRTSNNVDHTLRAARVTRYLQVKPPTDERPLVARRKYSDRDRSSIEPPSWVYSPPSCSPATRPATLTTPPSTAVSRPSRQCHRHTRNVTAVPLRDSNLVKSSLVYPHNPSPDPSTPRGVRAKMPKRDWTTSYPTGTHLGDPSCRIP